MAEKRTYEDDEVREIFALATRGQASGPAAAPASAGLTLAELQAIGGEVGLEPAEVARAAAAVEARRAGLPARTSIGMPVEVRVVVPLPRAPTDEEWDRLVSELRATFRARGRVSIQGGLREWYNGNLHACIEPADSGYRLRLGTLKGDARSMNALGGVAAAFGTALLGGTLLTAGVGEALLGPVLIAGSGAAVLVSNALRLPRWARERRQQMAHIAARAAEIVGPEPERE